jgi:hypothetical protein
MVEVLALEDVLRLVLDAARASSNACDDPDDRPLTELISAYDTVLFERGIKEDGDRSIYRSILSMSLLTAPTWSGRLAELRAVRRLRCMVALCLRLFFAADTPLPPCPKPRTSCPPPHLIRRMAACRAASCTSLTLPRASCSCRAGARRRTCPLLCEED